MSKNVTSQATLNFDSANSAQRSSLPCLNSNKSIDEVQNGSIKKIPPVLSPYEEAVIERNRRNLNEFSTSHKKSEYALQQNVRGLVEHFGIEKIGFLTLTFADHVTEPKEAQRRFNSLRTNYLKKHYPHYIRVIERHKSGRLHYHLLVVCNQDIRRGITFTKTKKGYKGVNPNLRSLWKSLNENLKKYGFGRSELLPIKTNSKGISRYVSKYIGKHITQRKEEDKGVRLCQTSIDRTQVWKQANSNFQFLSKGSREWRKKLSAWIVLVNAYMKIKYRDNPREYTEIDEFNYTNELKKQLSPKWAFLNQKTIFNIVI